MAAPIVAAGLAAIAKYIIKNGMKLAIKKYGKKAAEEGGKLASKSKPFRSKKTKLKYRDLEPGGSANNPAPQQAKPTRMPKQKNMQGPKNPKGMGFSGGGKVTHQDYRKKGMFK